MRESEGAWAARQMWQNQLPEGTATSVAQLQAGGYAVSGVYVCAHVTGDGQERAPGPDRYEADERRSGSRARHRPTEDMTDTAGQPPE